MLVGDESQSPPQDGRFAIKLRSEGATVAAVLPPFEQIDVPQYWRMAKDHIELFFDDKNIDALRNEYLTTSGKTFIPTDSTGAM